MYHDCSATSINFALLWRRVLVALLNGEARAEGTSSMLCHRRVKKGSHSGLGTERDVSSRAALKITDNKPRTCQQHGQHAQIDTSLHTCGSHLPSLLLAPAFTSSAFGQAMWEVSLQFMQRLTKSSSTHVCAHVRRLPFGNSSSPVHRDDHKQTKIERRGVAYCLNSSMNQHNITKPSTTLGRGRAPCVGGTPCAGG